MYGFEDLNIIEKVHKYVLRKLIGARKSTPSYIIYGEFGRYPLEITVKNPHVITLEPYVNGQARNKSHYKLTNTCFLKILIQNGLIK